MLLLWCRVVLGKDLGDCVLPKSFLHDLAKLWMLEGLIRHVFEGPEDFRIELSFDPANLAPNFLFEQPLHVRICYGLVQDTLSAGTTNQPLMGTCNPATLASQVELSFSNQPLQVLGMG